MPESHSLPERIGAIIHHPTCPKCDTQMMLARIMPLHIGFDLRTFECPKCDYAHQVMVETAASGRN
jgi:transposase-like protein